MSFLRVAWGHAWKTNCAVHGTRLLRTDLKIMHGIGAPKASVEHHRLRTAPKPLDSISSNQLKVASTKA
jgi:hypothetical protein